MNFRMTFTLCALLAGSMVFLAAKTKPLKTQVIAHRGAWKNTQVPQNSIAALQKAIQMGCFGSEFDVHLSADSIPVVNHDHTYKGVHLEKTTAAELQQVLLPNGEPIPTLEAYLLEGKKQEKTRLVLEIKASQLGKARSLLLADYCVEWVKKTQTQGLVDYISFDYDVCKRVKQLDPKANVAYLLGDKDPAQVAADGLWGLDYNHSVYTKNEGWIIEAKQKGLTLNVWTVNSSDQMKWFIERGFDYITTDEPEQLMLLLGK